ncbi:alpha/beta fold hydrolase [Falsiroseomonas sp. E2-1-a20]|uniref:alpha/beta fold hydrolase n=1 Tax=Falsiroseomonas sp. E2-1-a20 TaxID=3239300 RepID=UPI003F31428D
MASLTINGHDMAYIEQGAGDPLVLVHGSLSDYRHWAPQMEDFAAAGFRTVAVSLRHYWPENWDGIGRSFTVDQHVADLADFITALGAGPAHLIGHSRGAHIAFRLAERYPRLLKRLILAEPSGVLDASLLPEDSKPGSYTALIADAVEKVRRGDVVAGLRSFYEYAVGPGSWDRLSAERKQINMDNASTLLGQIDEGRTPYSRSSAEAISVPTLLVGGALTRPAFVTVLDGLEKSIYGVRRATIPDAGHPMSRENPAAFNAAVLDFLHTA